MKHNLKCNTPLAIDACMQWFTDHSNYPDRTVGALVLSSLVMASRSWHDTKHQAATLLQKHVLHRFRYIMGTTGMKTSKPTHCFYSHTQHCTTGQWPWQRPWQWPWQHNKNTHTCPNTRSWVLFWWPALCGGTAHFTDIHPVSDGDGQAWAFETKTASGGGSGKTLTGATIHHRLLRLGPLCGQRQANRQSILGPPPAPHNIWGSKKTENPELAMKTAHWMRIKGEMEWEATIKYG